MTGRSLVLSTDDLRGDFFFFFFFIVGHNALMTATQVKSVKKIPSTLSHCSSVMSVIICADALMTNRLGEEGGRGLRWGWRLRGTDQNQLHAREQADSLQDKSQTEKLPGGQKLTGGPTESTTRLLEFTCPHRTEQECRLQPAHKPGAGVFRV